MVNFVDFMLQYRYVGVEIEKSVTKVLRSSKYVLSEEVKRFEERLAEYCNVKYAVGVANGTDALVIALRAMDIGPGDEVITTPFTFFATAEAISLVGARPVFIDIDEKNLCMDPDMIEEKITERTRAILPVHIFGQMADMDRIIDIATKYRLKIIEDACQAIGAQYKNHKAGSMGDIGCFSFYPTKNLSCAGDGGALVTNDSDLYEKILLLRTHGSTERYRNDLIGYNSRLDEIQAAILNVKLEYLEQWNNERNLIAKLYERTLGELENIKTPGTDLDRKHVYHLYSIRVADRNSLKKYLDYKGIGNGIYYPIALFDQKPYRESNKGISFPVTSKVVEEIISIPLYPGLPLEDQNTIMECIRDFYVRRDATNGN
jgi:Predicted pyridoxal phosphate-dependent enzyme apparently involved in regulation of cell wall biogenesis